MTECCYAEWHYAEGRKLSLYAGCPYAKCHYTECRGALRIGISQLYQPSEAISSARWGTFPGYIETYTYYLLTDIGTI